MFFATTHSLEGKKITAYHGMVYGETVMGINILKDVGAALRNIVGGRSQGYEDEVMKGRMEILQEMSAMASAKGANGVIGIQFDIESLGEGGMLLMMVSGTAVTIEE